jgi:molecular chaperone IbpA
LNNLALKEGCDHAYDRPVPPVSLRRRLRPAGRPAGRRRLERSRLGLPPYNIERTAENAYRIEIAVAGFKSEELGIEVKENLLTVTGRKPANDEAKRYLHRGLAERNFERRFQLADYVIVTDAALSDGLLSISLKRELPEALKPRTIEIKSAAPLIEGRRRGKIEGEKAA